MNTKKKLQSSSIPGMGAANGSTGLSVANGNKGLSVANGNKGLSVANGNKAVGGRPTAAVNNAALHNLPTPGKNVVDLGNTSPQSVTSQSLNPPKPGKNVVDMGTASPQSMTGNGQSAPGTQGSRPTFEASEALNQAAQALADAENGKPQPYQSSYADQINGMIDSILNQQPFQYDPAADPLYQQYAQQYQRNGDLAMRDAMARSAALTGGYGNTYAQMAGQQAYQRQLEGMNEALPQLQQAAYQMYLDNTGAQRNNLNMLLSAEESDYGRYRDDLNDWQNQRDYLSGRYDALRQDEYNRYLQDQQNWEDDRLFAYQQQQDQAAQDWQQQQFAYQQQQDQLAHDWNQQQFAYQQQQDQAAQDWQQQQFAYQQQQDQAAQDWNQQQFAYQQQLDQAAQDWQQQQFAYQQQQDLAAQDWQQQQFAYQQEQDQAAQDWQQQQFAYQQEQDQANWDWLREQFEYQKQQDEQKRKGSSGGGSSSSSGQSGKKPNWYDQVANTGVNAALTGIGMLTGQPQQGAGLPADILEYLKNNSRR